MKLGQKAMNAALGSLHNLQYSKKLASAWEAMLVGYWLAANSITKPSIAKADEAVEVLFTLDSNNSMGRLTPFRFGWSNPKQSGRKTVWNQTTRDPNKAAAQLFGGHISNGLSPDAVTQLLELTPDVDHRESIRPNREALSALLARDHNFEDGAGWNEAHKAAREVLGMSVDDYEALTDSAPLGVPLLEDEEWSMSGIPADLVPTPTKVVVAQTPAHAPGTSHREEMVVEARTERMIRRAVARFPFILLVGPPGTGKGTMVNWIVQEVRQDPASFGFEDGFNPKPMWRTPDESWASFDLVGGLAPNQSGQLEWSRGPILDAIEEDRWLVLDETNRADMDRIMGPLFTWLSGQKVELGRNKPHDGMPVTLGWTDEAASGVDAEEHLAGRQWRLLGTYNPQDAQRVFRMGLALSRRFVVIPIPALAPDRFESLLSSRFPDLDPDLQGCVQGLYSAHHANEHTVLGPAVFLRIAEYLDGYNPDHDSAEELLAEAYVMNLGKYVASYDDVTVGALGQRIVNEENALTSEGWQWVKTQRMTLG